MLTASAMGHFEDEIKAAVVLALFIPLVISSGGNSGSQAATLIVRSLALGELQLRDWWRVGVRELGSGLLLGGWLGMIGFARVLIWQKLGWSDYGEHSMRIAITVWLSLIGVVSFGTIAGSLLPFALRSLRLDPATSSAPFVATLVDVTGLIIYFSAAALILARHGALKARCPGRGKRRNRARLACGRAGPEAPVPRKPTTPATAGGGRRLSERCVGVRRSIRVRFSGDGGHRPARPGSAGPGRRGGTTAPDRSTGKRGGSGRAGRVGEVVQALELAGPWYLYIAKASMDAPVVGAPMTRQPLAMFAAFAPVNSTPIHRPPRFGPFEVISRLTSMLVFADTDWVMEALPAPSELVEKTMVLAPRPKSVPSQVISAT